MSIFGWTFITFLILQITGFLEISGIVGTSAFVFIMILLFLSEIAVLPLGG